MLQDPMSHDSSDAGAPAPPLQGRSFVEWVTGEGQKDSGWRRAVAPSQIPEALIHGDIAVVYQPIVDLRTNKVFAQEALLRSTAPSFAGVEALILDAVEAGCMGSLGRAVRDMAVDGCPAQPLFLNVHPSEFDEGWLVRPDDPLFRHEHPVYLEVTESVPLSHFALCHSVLAELRHKGIMLAVDDLGAGYSNLKYIADLSPEVVKLDRGLVAHLRHDSRQQRLVAALVRLCEDLGAKVVAEGIETAAELDVVRACGAHYGQGYHFARPTFPPPTISR
jgi:EAL domain-containing protein (putative c-di-GMP-specific phosphodiesterase class I)